MTANGKPAEWTKYQLDKLIELRNQFVSYDEIARAIKRTPYSVQHKIRSLIAEGILEPIDPRIAAAKAVESRKQNERVAEQALSDGPEPAIAYPKTMEELFKAFKTMRVAATKKVAAQMQADADNPPVEVDDKATIMRLESELARLKTQLTWAQHAESSNRTGGLLTLRASDHHYGDAQHLLSCGHALEEKFLEVVKQYEPERIQLIAGDDWIAGRGIYREQDLDMATSDVNEQIALGSVKAYELLTRIRQITDVPVTWRVLRGNHDFANKISMTESLFLSMKVLCADIPNVDFVMHWDCLTANLADEGTYNVLVRHGFGYSKISPAGPAFIDAVKDEILSKQRFMLPHQHYRRVISGHGHWAAIGIEHIVGLPFDTAGGLQRNVRIRLGANQRPVGWVVYASPKGMQDGILNPLMLVPDEQIYIREVSDPHLAATNRTDAGNCIRKYHEIMESRGVFGEGSSFGAVNSGRW